MDRKAARSAVAQEASYLYDKSRTKIPGTSFGRAG
jgi:hypothetical protein